MTGWDEAQLAEELDALRDVFDIEGFGFEEKEPELEQAEPELEFAQALDTHRDYIVLQFTTKEDWTWAAQLLGVEMRDLAATGTTQRRGHGRVIDGTAALEGIVGH